jgi:hypothetical protein
VFNGFVFEFLTAFTLGDHNFLIFNLFLMIINVLDAPRGGLQALFGHQKRQNLWLLYSNTLVASNVQLSWFMKFIMEFFIPYPLASNFIWLNI